MLLQQQSSTFSCPKYRPRSTSKPLTRRDLGPEGPNHYQHSTDSIRNLGHGKIWAFGPYFATRYTPHTARASHFPSEKSFSFSSHRPLHTANPQLPSPLQALTWHSSRPLSTTHVAKPRPTGHNTTHLRFVSKAKLC